MLVIAIGGIDSLDDAFEYGKHVVAGSINDVEALGERSKAGPRTAGHGRTPRTAILLAHAVR